MGIALMSFTETIAVGRAFAGAEESPPRANRELLATGLATVGGAFLGAMAAGGGTSQTAVNRLAGSAAVNSHNWLPPGSCWQQCSFFPL